MKQLLLLAAAGSLLMLLSTEARAQDIFNIEDQLSNIGLSISASPTISASAPSIRTATLSQSNLGPGFPGSVAGFQFADNNGGGLVAFGTNLSNIVITDAGDATALDILTLTFAQPVSGLTFSFATVPAVNLPGTPNLVTLFATTDNALVFGAGTGLFNGTSLDNEGTLTLSGGTFNVLNLFLGGTAVIGDTFAVDNFIVTPSVTPVPEPGSIALLLGTALPVAWSLKRRCAQNKRSAAAKA